MNAWDFLPSAWSNFALPTNIQKRLYKFLLRKAIGQFLANELDLDNFDIELVQGSVELRDLDLNLQTLNDCIADTPFEIVEGKVSSITASLPWSNFWSGNIALKIQGLNLALRPVKGKKFHSRTKDEEESPIMSSSLHFADDFLRTEMEDDDELRDSIQQSFHADSGASSSVAGDIDMETNGLQVLTTVIDKMLARVKVDIIDTQIRIIHKSPAPSCQAGDSRPYLSENEEYFIDINLPRISYFDETPTFNPESAASRQTQMAESSVNLPSNANGTIKIITLASATISMRLNPASSSPLYNIPTQSETMLQTAESNIEDESVFYEAEQGDSTLFYSTTSSYMSGSTTPRAYPRQNFYSSASTNSVHRQKPYEALLVSTMDKENWVRLKLRPSFPFDAKTADMPIIKQIDFLCTHVRAIISPRQTSVILDLLQFVLDEWPTPETTAKASPVPVEPRKQQLDILQKDKDNDISARRTRSLLHSSRPSNQAPSTLPELKIKVQITKFECFVLHQDPPDPMRPQYWRVSEDVPCKDISHLRISLEQTIMRLQQFSKDKSNIARRKSESWRPTMSPRLDTSTMLADAYPLSILDVRVSGFAIDELVVRPASVPLRKSDSSWQMRYDAYIPIFEFDSSIQADYDSQTKDFPAIFVRPPMEHGKGCRGEVIRMRFETKQLLGGSRFGSLFNQDTQIDMEPFIIHVNPQILDRLESYVYIVMKMKERQSETTKAEDMSASSNSFGQRIYEDLDRISDHETMRRKVRLRCSFIRAILYVPDMSQVSMRDEFNDQNHSDMLLVDIKKLLATWTSDVDSTDARSDGIATNFQHYSQPRSSSENGDNPIKIVAECNFINVFLRQAPGKDIFLQETPDDIARCWFSATTMHSSSTAAGVSFSAPEAPLSPSFVITLRSSLPSTINKPSSGARPGCFGAGSDIPNNLFEHLSRNESFQTDQKINVPIEEQAESAMMFKQRTVETSLVVVNCHFPITRLDLTKKAWDTIQILQNDLILWQPRFLAQFMEQTRDESSQTSGLPANYMQSSSSNSNVYGKSLDFNVGSPGTLPESSVLSQSQERLGAELQEPSLLSLVAVMSKALWSLHCSSGEKISSYLLHMLEFRYFTVVKHLNTNENITTLDIDELSLERIVPNMDVIVNRNLPKTLTGTSTSMISILSRLSMQPELNKQTKMSSIVASNFCWHANLKPDYLDELIDFQKVPDEMVYIDPPTQYTKVYAHVLDTSADYKPLHLPSRCILTMDDVQIITDLVSSGQPFIDVKLYLQSLNVYLMDDASALDVSRAAAQMGSVKADADRYWTALGFPRVLASRHLEARAKVKLDDNVAGAGVELSVLNNLLVLEGCADSFQSFMNFATYLANEGDIMHDPTLAQSKKLDKGKQKMRNPRKPIVTKRRSRQDGQNEKDNLENDMLASLDPEAFRRWASPERTGKAETSSSGSGDKAGGENGLDFSYVEGYYSSTASSPSVGDCRPPKPKRKHLQQKTQEDHIIRVLDGTDADKLSIVEDFYSTDKSAIPPEKSAVDSTRALFSVRVRDFDVVVKLYDRLDADYLQSDSTDSNKHRSSRPSSMVSSGSSPQYYDDAASRASSLDTTTMGTPPIEQYSPSLSSEHSDTVFIDKDGARGGLLRARRGGAGRRRRPQAADIEIHLENVEVDFNLMPPIDSVGLHLLLNIRDFEVIDNIKTSRWNKFLGYMRPGAHQLPRERGSSMLRFELTGVRPVQDDPTLEYRVKLKLLPLRLYIDQDALNFLVNYFTFDKSILRSTSAANKALLAKKELQDPEDVEEIFFQHIDIQPIVLKIDYKPKYINYGNIKEGQYAELVNLFHLDGADVQLSHVKLTGVNGLVRLGDRLAQEWLPHIMNTQVPHMISGVSPIRSIVNIGSGMADLVLLPVQQYRKDGRIIRGIQKGTQSFAKATAMEAIKLSTRFASGAQVILEHADDFFSSTPKWDSEAAVASTHSSTTMEEEAVEEEGYIYADAATAAAAAQEYVRARSQPSDLSQGLQYAYQNITRNLGSAAHTIFAVPTEIVRDQQQQEQSSGQARVVIRAVPVAVIKPMIGLTGAFQSILVGLRNTIDPAMRLQSEDKYKKMG